LIYHMLKTAGLSVSMVTSNGAWIHDKEYNLNFHVTNPGSFPLQRFLRLAVRKDLSKNKNFLVLEVTSHGIDQHRIWGIPFAYAVITNITHEHLDYHKTYQAYLKTKAKLLQKASVPIVNRDDMSYDYLMPLLTGKKVISYSLENNNADITLKTIPFSTKLLGDYNKRNILAAIAVVKQIGVSSDIIKNAITTFHAPLGRTDIIFNDGFSVMIDFAHTPNAFTQILSSVRPQVKGKIIHVFGSAGKRDKTKRPLMGKASSQFADVIILTAEDPRNESIQSICKDIASGFIGKPVVFVIEDRKKAIEKALSIAKENDMVLLTGKGHEKSINYGRG
ncbi:MAG: Mur ligase family protein, partial [Candidatus Levyibacteriota bacterium]